MEKQLQNWEKENSLCAGEHIPFASEIELISLESEMQTWKRKEIFTNEVKAKTVRSEELMCDKVNNLKNDEFH